MDLVQAVQLSGLYVSNSQCVQETRGIKIHQCFSKLRILEEMDLFLNHLLRFLKVSHSSKLYPWSIAQATVFYPREQLYSTELLPIPSTGNSALPYICKQWMELLPHLWELCPGRLPFWKATIARKLIWKLQENTIYIFSSKASIISVCTFTDSDALPSDCILKINLYSANWCTHSKVLFASWEESLNLVSPAVWMYKRDHWTELTAAFIIAVEN